MNRIEAQEQQSEIFDRIFASSVDVIRRPIVSGLLRKTLSYSQTDVEFALGEFGVRLWSFASSIDLDYPHPDIFKIFNGALVFETSDFGKGVGDILDLMIYGQDRHTSEVVLHGLRKQLSKLPDFKLINRAIDAPARNLLHVRMIKDIGLRNDIRSKKKGQPITLGSFYKKGPEVWDQHLASFTSFWRHSNQFNEDISEAKLRFQHFNLLGLTAMAKGIENSIFDMEKKLRETQYFGFNQISLTFASVILAKLLGCWMGPEKKIMHNSCSYVAFAHTYQELEKFASDEVRKVFEFVERFPEIGYKPLFDHYRVLLPVLAEVRQTGVLLGERDGQFYFICFWM